MPKHWFQREMETLGDADVNHVRQLAKIFDTSLEATANRYAELTDDRCAFVFSKDGLIRYTRASRGFPRLGVRPGDRTPAVVGSDWREVGGSIWLAERQGQRQPSILEQTVAQANGYQVSLLFIEGEPDDEDDEEGESWQPKFRR